jgi:cobalt-zinc-cadmium efflux system outer membrane protein
MTRRWVAFAIAGLVSGSAPVRAQTPSAAPESLARRYVDRVNGLSLEQAIARATRDEPSFAAARTEIDRARGMRMQAGLRPNPTLATEWTREPGGTDSQTGVSVEWPLDLFRRSGRVAVAERQLEATRAAVANRERLLVADVRARYGELLTAVRLLTVSDELAAAARRQHSLLRARVDEGAAPALERDLLDVELRRVEADRLLLAGRADEALFELKRTLGLSARDPLMVRETLDDLVLRDPPPLAGAEAPREDVVAAALNRADVRQAAADVHVAEAIVDRARREGRADVNVFGSYMRMDAGFPQLGFVATEGPLERVRGRFNYFSIGATMSLPVRNRNQGEIAAGEAQRRGAAALQEAAALAAQAEIASARARDARAREALALYTGGAHALARQNLTVVGETYELGRATVFDVLAEQRRFLDFERAYTEALNEAYEARTALRRAVGEGQ